MKPAADFLEARNALLLALRDHDKELKVKKRKPGEDRAAIFDMLCEMGCSPWTYEEESWLK